MNILLTGASSSPGYRLLQLLIERGAQVIGVYKNNPVKIENEHVKLVKLDLTNTKGLIRLFEKAQLKNVIHIASIGDVNLCEENKELAWRVNVEATRQLAKLSERYGSKFIYLSTDYVFDGEKGFYKEDNTPNPINYYGLTKLIAEEIVKSTLDDALIVRTSAIYGFGMGRMNFGKFLIEALGQGREVKAITDQWLSPTHNTLLAQAIIQLLEKDAIGTYHVAGERASRYEFAVRLAEKFGFNKSLIKPAKMSDFTWKARRPKDSSLDTSKARKEVSISFDSLDYSLNLLYKEWLLEKGE